MAVLDIASEFLSINGYDAITATDGKEAVRAFHEAKDSKRNVVAVILDLTVPGGMGGKDTIPLLRKIKHPHPGDRVQRLLQRSGDGQSPEVRI